MATFITNLYEQLSSLDFKNPELAKKKYVVVHHSLTEDGKTVNWDAIRKYHMSWRVDGNSITEEEAKEAQAAGKVVEAPWDDIGYNYGIEEANGKLNFMMGHTLYKRGIHAAGFNTNGIGLCIIGNFQKVKPSKEKFEMAALACQYMRKVWYDRLRTNLQIIGHRETFVLLKQPVHKDCPGSAWDMDLFRNVVFGTKTIDEAYA
ncbi:N-acetylmuramoyl-L-alanine amidase [uncultured archaeon]|nr:N-acetylmuramoyl-L-alanine amidase [uncultured archaeon]